MFVSLSLDPTSSNPSVKVPSTENKSDIVFGDYVTGRTQESMGFCVVVFIIVFKPATKLQ